MSFYQYINYGDDGGKDEDDGKDGDDEDDDKVRWCSALNFEHLQPTSSICQLFRRWSFEQKQKQTL